MAYLWNCEPWQSSHCVLLCTHNKVLGQEENMETDRQTERQETDSLGNRSHMQGGSGGGFLRKYLNEGTL